VRRLRWTIRARQQLNDWIERLQEDDDLLAMRASAQTEARIDKLAERPFDCRLSRWPGFRELSLPRWSKIVIYRVSDDEVVITAFYDARQDIPLRQAPFK
jgi:plasmid stabilization system protein ParE